MVRAASEEALGIDVSHLSDLKWHASISVDISPKDVFIEMESNPENLKFSLKSLSQQTLVTHLDGFIDLAEQKSIIPRPLDIQRIKKIMEFSLGAEEINQYLTSLGSRFGPSMQTINHVNTSAQAAIAEIDFAEESSDKLDFFLHPALMNAALCTCLTITKMSKSGQALPLFEICNLYIYKPVNSACYAYAELINIDKNTLGETKRLDVTVTNLKGEVLVKIEGVSTQNIKFENDRLNAKADIKHLAELKLKTVEAIELELVIIDQLNQYLVEIVAGVIAMPIDQYEADEKFQNYGIDSIMLSDIRNKIEKTFADLPKTLLFEYDSVASLSQHLMTIKQSEIELKFGHVRLGPSPTVGQEQGTANSEHKPMVPDSLPEQEKMDTSYLKARDFDMRKLKADSLPDALNQRSSYLRNHTNSVAVIGMSGVFPDSPNLEEFWENVRTGKNCLKEIPKDRWSAEDYFNGTQSALNGKSMSKWGGFIDDIYHFDAPFFNVTDDEARLMDPQLRLMMRTAYQTVEDAGYSPSELHNFKVGVYIGVMNNDFTWIVSEAYSATGQYFGPGTFASDIANRVSSLLNVAGPSLSVETACASSSTAIHLARKAIIDGECAMAIAGGVNVSLHHGKYLMLDQVKVLAPDGLEKTFDDSANGLVPGEGVGAVLLKPYEQAIRDGDQIYGVLSGTSIGHSGIGPAANLPSVGSLEKNIVKAIEDSGVDARSFSYIESHGTGTALGDPIELKALNNALNRYSDKTNYCAIGTKANLGHLEAASGICSLIKVLYSFKHNELAPCANLSKVSRAFDVEKSPFYFPNKLECWESDGTPRITGINSYGLGGSNAFLIIESHQQVESTLDESSQVIILSANSKEQLLQQAKNMLSYAKKNLHINFADFAYTLQMGRKHFPLRLGLVAPNLKTFIRMVTKHISDSDKTIKKLVVNHTGEQIRQDAASLENAVESKNLLKMVEFWVLGAKIDWSTLHVGGRIKCSLPTYPFDEKECKLIVPTRVSEKVKEVRERDKESMNNIAQLMEYEASWFEAQRASRRTDKIINLTAKEQASTEWYWKDHLQNLVSAKALTPQETQSQPNLQRVVTVLEQDLFTDLQRFTQKYSVERETIFIAAWSLILGHITKSSFSLFATLNQFTDFDYESGKRAGDQQIPILIKNSTKNKIPEWLQDLQKVINKKYDFAYVGFNNINEWVDVDSICQSILAFSNKAIALGQGCSGLACNIFTRSNTIEINLDFDRNLFEEVLANRIVQLFEVVICAMIENPLRNPAAISMRTPDEQRSKFWKTLEK